MKQGPPVSGNVTALCKALRFPAGDVRAGHGGRERIPCIIADIRSRRSFKIGPHRATGIQHQCRGRDESQCAQSKIQIHTVQSETGVPAPVGLLLFLCQRCRTTTAQRGHKIFPQCLKFDLFRIQLPINLRADTGRKPSLKEKRSGKLETGRSATGSKTIFEAQLRRNGGQQLCANHENGKGSDDGRQLRLVQLPLDKSSYQALMMRIVAVRMKCIMQGRTRRQRQEKQ